MFVHVYCSLAFIDSLSASNRPSKVSLYGAKINTDNASDIDIDDVTLDHRSVGVQVSPDTDSQRPLRLPSAAPPPIPRASLRHRSGSSGVRVLSKALPRKSVRNLMPTLLEDIAEEGSDDDNTGIDLSKTKRKQHRDNRRRRMGVLALHWDNCKRLWRRVRAALSDPIPVWRGDIKVCRVQSYE